MLEKIKKVFLDKKNEEKVFTESVIVIILLSLLQVY